MSQPTLDLDGLEPTYGVAELNRRVGTAIAAAFPDEVWVRGEIRGWQVSASGHAYFTLVEEVRGSAQPAELAVVLFARERRRVQHRLRQVPDFSFGDGIEVRVRGRVAYYAPRGRVQLQMTDVDPVHTLGRLAADRSRVLRALAAEGLLDRNRARPLPLAPLHIGLVTSDGSAAHVDFLHELQRSGFAFSVTFVHARVQGRGAEGSVVRAIRRLGEATPDVIAIVRGGGSRTDLATFDHEAVARAIAACPVPVITGIGHEVDTSIADEVAHTACKTPTACAGLLVEQVGEALARAEAAWAQIVQRATDQLRACDDELVTRARRAATATRQAVAVQSQLITAHAGGVARLARARARDHERRVARGAGRLTPTRVRSLLRPHEAALATSARRLRTAALRPLVEAAAQLDLAAARVGAADPDRALARGWSLTYTDDGRLVRGVAGLASGAELTTRFADGTARSRVESVAPHDPPTAENHHDR